MNLKNLKKLKSKLLGTGRKMDFFHSLEIIKEDSLPFLKNIIFSDIEEFFLRASAVESLGKIGVSALPILEEILRDKYDVRFEANEARKMILEEKYILDPEKKRKY